MGRKPQRFFRQFGGNNQYFSKAAKLARARYTQRWFSFAGRAAGVLGAAATAAVSNYLAPVPKIDQEMRMVGYKRTRGGKAAPVQDKGGYVQLSYKNATAGRKRSKRTKVMKLVNAMTRDTFERFQHVTNTSSGAGAYYLSHDDGVTTATDCLLPLYFMDLTCIRNKVKTGSLSDPKPFTRMIRNRSFVGRQIGAYYTTVVAGKTADGVDSEIWQKERAYDAHASSSHERSHIDWCDIRLVLYGARKCPLWVQVMIVQFTDDDFVPGAYSSEGIVDNEAGRITTTDDPLYNRWQTAWQGFTDNTVSSVIGMRDLREQNVKFKIKYHKKFVFNPTMNTESDISGHQVAFKLRYGMNKVCTYIEDSKDHGDVTAVPDEMGDPNRWPVYDSVFTSTHTAKRGREFLVIKGYAGKPSSQLGTDAVYDFAPSFDIMVRRKRSHLTVT